MQSSLHTRGQHRLQQQSRCLSLHQPQQQLAHLRRPSRCSKHTSRQHLRVAAADGDPPPSKEDRDKQGKADFSAYWSLKFREFFSKRRQYLELARKRQEPPEIFKKIDEQIRVQEEKIEAARMQAR